MVGNLAKYWKEGKGGGVFSVFSFQWGEEGRKWLVVSG